MKTLEEILSEGENYLSSDPLTNDFKLGNGTVPLDDTDNTNTKESKVSGFLNSLEGLLSKGEELVTTFTKKPTNVMPSPPPYQSPSSIKPILYIGGSALVITLILILVMRKKQ